MKKITIILLIINYVLADRGDLISSSMLSTRNLNNNQIYIDNELSSNVTGQFSLDPVAYGYWMFKITYETIDINGNAHQATGSIAFPRVDWPLTPSEAYPVLSYQHGTVVEKSSVSSVSGVWILPAFLAGSGYVYVEPDYLGLGDSEGMHPYQIKEPYGTAIVDLLRATTEFANSDERFAINSQLFLVGYSEGGYATMAAHQIIERDYSDEFTITASYPMAGAYSMSEIMVDVMLSYQEYGEPFYFPYVLFAYVDSYPEIGLIGDYLLDEFLFLEDMFDGYHSSQTINDSMPSIPATIMIPDSVLSFQENFNHPLKVALRNNDLWDWYPDAPMYLFHGLADELVPYQNSELAYNQFIENGIENVSLHLIPESYGGHQDVAPWALLGAFEFAQEIQEINCLIEPDCMGICGGNAFIDICGECSIDDDLSCNIGDANLDGEINILDIVVVIDAIFDNSYNQLIDLNNDSFVNVFDIVLIVELILER